MTDTQKPNPATQPETEKDGTDTTRPNQSGTRQPGQQPGSAATGGQGAAGAGGPKGFGTGT